MKEPSAPSAGARGNAGRASTEKVAKPWISLLPQWTEMLAQ